MEVNRSKFRVAKMAKLLEVSKSGFYAYLNRPKSRRAIENEQLLEQIKVIHKKSHRIYGSPRITVELADQGSPSRNRVARLMHQNGLRAKTVKKYRATTNSNHNLPVAENLLNQDFKAERPNQKWVSDITYVATDEGWLYLAGIMDLCGRAIVGFAMAEHMRTTLVSNALTQAIGRTGAGKGLLAHSDRGVQYASKEYQHLLAKNGFVCSMSRKGNCYDNAPMESFWGKLKQEWLYDRRFRTRAEAKAAIFEYIEVFYNRRRRHSSCGNIAPLTAIKKAA
jgi:putative transposase